MSKLHQLVLVVAICATASLTTAAAASAAPCYSSTPNSASLADATNDAEFGLSPEVISMSVSIDGACNATISYGVIGQTGPIVDDFYGWFLNTDNNLATGSQGGFKGADAAVGLNYTGSAALSYWNGVEFATVKQIPRAGVFGVGTTLADLGANPGVPISVAGGASWEGLSDTYYDWVPEVAAPWLAIVPQFSSQAPPPPPVEPGCIVPKVRGLSVSKAKSKIRNAGCRVGSTRKRVSSSYVGKAIGTSPGKGASLAAGARVNIYVGKKPKRKSRKSSVSAAGSTAELTTVRINQLLAAAD